MRERERIQNLKARQEVGQRQLESLEDERQNVLKKITITQRHLAQLPIREQEMTSLTRDYEITKAHYQSLMDKQLAAGMATEMERRQKSERFTMLDAARVPDQPVKPNRPLYCALGSALGLILGLTISLGVESKRNVLLGEWELPREIVVLGQVPRIRMATSYGSDSAGAHKAGLRLVLRNRYLLLTFFGILLLILGIWIGVNFRWLSQWVASVK